MTVFEYAMYRYVAQLMEPDEHKRAERLARKADAGDRVAQDAFKDLIWEVLRDAKSRPAVRLGRNRRGGNSGR